MKIFTLIILSTLSFQTFAKEKHAEHRHHESHVHGAAELAIAFEGNKGKIEFKAAAEGILGFEKIAKNKKELQKVQEVTKMFEKNISQYVQLDASLKCQYSKEKIEQIAEANQKGSGTHSDWVANYKLTCDKSPVGTKLTVDFKEFKKLKDVDITLLADTLQKSAEYKGKPVVIELK